MKLQEALHGMYCQLYCQLCCQLLVNYLSSSCSWICTTSPTKRCCRGCWNGEADSDHTCLEGRCHVFWCSPSAFLIELTLRRQGQTTSQRRSCHTLRSVMAFCSSAKPFNTFPQVANGSLIKLGGKLLATRRNRAKNSARDSLLLFLKCFSCWSARLSRGGTRAHARAPGRQS